MIEPLFFSILCLYYLEQIELQIVCLLHIPQNRMVWRLLPCFNLTQGNSRICCCLVQHLDKQLLGHKMRAGTGRKISPTRQKTHRTQIDFLISTHCTFHCLSGLGKCWRVEDDKIKLTISVDHFSLRKFWKQVKHVGCQILYLSIQPRAGVAMAAAVFMLVPPIVIFMLAQRQVIETMAHSGIKD